MTEFRRVACESLTNAKPLSSAVQAGGYTSYTPSAPGDILLHTQGWVTLRERPMPHKKGSARTEHQRHKQHQRNGPTMVISLHLQFTCRFCSASAAAAAWASALCLIAAAAAAGSWYRCGAYPAPYPAPYACCCCCCCCWAGRQTWGRGRERHENVLEKIKRGCCVPGRVFADRVLCPHLRGKSRVGPQQASKQASNPVSLQTCALSL